MSKEETRKEVLELLARGKISIDEAVTLLDQTASKTTGAVVEEDLPLKVDVDVDLDVEIEKDAASRADLDLEIESIPMAAEKPAAKEPRWLRLRIFVGDLDTGKSKVKVNVPFGMVKFGLGVAQMFAPEEYSANINQIEGMIAESDSGLLVDVQDEESNEHVRIYFD